MPKHPPHSEIASPKLVIAAVCSATLLATGFLLPASAADSGAAPASENLTSAFATTADPVPVAPSTPPAIPSPATVDTVTETPAPAPVIGQDSGAAEVQQDPVVDSTNVTIPSPDPTPSREPARPAPEKPEPTNVATSNPAPQPTPEASPRNVPSALLPQAPTPTPEPTRNIPAGIIAAATPTPEPTPDKPTGQALLAAASELKDNSSLGHGSSRAGEWRNSDRTVEASTPRSYAVQRLDDMGWSLKQWAYLDRLWWLESNWNPRSGNTISGAYGIPQALPAEKMASAGDDWRTNAKTQIDWGMGYIKSRYGSPKEALEFWSSHGWY